VAQISAPGRRAAATDPRTLRRATVFDCWRGRCCWCRERGAHEVRPGFLELRATASNVFLMTWKVPALGAYRLGIEPRLPDSCHLIGQPATVQTGGAFIEYGRVNCARALEGQRIAIDRLDGTLTDVLVRIESADGNVRTARLTPSTPSFIVPEAPGPLMVLHAYVGLGVEHILFGIDHLLFVLCLLLLSTNHRFHRDFRNGGAWLFRLYVLLHAVGQASLLMFRFIRIACGKRSGYRRLGDKAACAMSRRSTPCLDLEPLRIFALLTSAGFGPDRGLHAGSGLSGPKS
jgi:HupE / UreJ protein